jgi:hypothetical protein
MSPAQALRQLVDAIDAQTARTGVDNSGYIRLAWVAPELAEAWAVLEQERQCENVVG